MKPTGLQWVLGFGLTLWVMVSFAGAADETGAEPVALEPVTVVGAVEERIDGKSSLNMQQIQALPQGNGSLNELLTVLPSVQASDMASTSLQGGEIDPPNISITGGKVFDNNFMIDGLGVNNLLDPMSDDQPNSGKFLPGRVQTLYLDSSLINQVEVLDGNISAEYSGFTGGVVDADTISPGSTFGGSLRYRTTRSEWTEFHIDDDKEEENSFEQSRSQARQPEFDKYDAGVNLNIPLTDKMGVVTAYSTLDSKIRLTHLGETKDQLRRRENFFLKYEIDLTSKDNLSFTTIYQPERSDYFYPDSYESDYTIERITYSLSADYKHFFDFGELDFKFGYLQSDSERDAPPHLFIWAVSPSKPWGALVDSTSSREGMVGSLEERQQDYQLKTKFTSDPLKTGSIEHVVKAGIDYERVRGQQKREEDSYQFYSPSISSTVSCQEGAIDCIDGEQYFTRRFVFHASSIVEAIDLYQFYLEDLIRWKRLDLRPGLNVSYDDFMKNTNYAPRFSATYDVFGDDSTVLVAGANRYYGKTLLAYKLKEGSIASTTEKRGLNGNVPGTWVDQPGTYFADGILYTTDTTRGFGYEYSKLDTPYADELVFGLDQMLFGGLAKLRYIRRDGKDEYARESDAMKREDDVKYYYLNNNGTSRHEEYKVEWQKSWGRHYFEINATYQETRTSNESYTIDFDEFDAAELCWFDGQVYSCDELPRWDYNRPWVANFTYSVKLPYDFMFTNYTKYRSGYIGKDLLSAAEREERGVSESVTYAYEEEKQPESWIFDWKLIWRQNLYRNHGIQLSLEVNNVFNQKVPAGAAEEIQTYELGRQFWAGMEYYF